MIWITDISLNFQYHYIDVGGLLLVVFLSACAFRHSAHQTNVYINRLIDFLIFQQFPLTQAIALHLINFHRSGRFDAKIPGNFDSNFFCVRRTKSQRANTLKFAWAKCVVFGIKM